MVDNLISDAEVLRYLTEHGMIDRVTVTHEIEMTKKERYLNQHNCKIWLASDGYWKTKIPKGDGSKETRLIKKKKKSDVENEVVKYYKSHSEQYKFKERYNIWVNRQEICGRSDNTIYKYRTDYKRFFEGYPFENYDIRDITDEMLSEHILTVLKDKEIRWRAFKDIFGYINGVFEKAIKDKVIEENPCDYIDLPVYKSRCYEGRVETARERTLSDDEMRILMEH